MGGTVRGWDCPWVEVSWVGLSWVEMSVGGIVRGWKCPGWDCPGWDCPWVEVSGVEVSGWDCPGGSVLAPYNTNIYVYKCICILYSIYNTNIKVIGKIKNCRWLCDGCNSDELFDELCELNTIKTQIKQLNEKFEKLGKKVENQPAIMIT